MKKILLSALLFATACPAVDARDLKGCFLFGRRNKTTTTTTQWYKAKDGTLRKMLPYWDAMHRAEDADKLETDLQKSQADLAAAQASNAQTTAELTAAKAQAEALQKELEAARAQVAELTKQVSSEKTSVASQKERADKAENAHKTAIGQVATLREEAVRQTETLNGVRTELKTAAEIGRAHV